jgi:molybdate transport system ATP-binding protein
LRAACAAVSAGDHVLTTRLNLKRGEFNLRVSFAAPTPGLVALFGRSGCGKSTTVNLLAGLLRPDSGLVQVNGETLFDSARGVNVAAERRRIGYVFQDARLFPHLSVLTNLRYGAKRVPKHATMPIAFDEVIDLLGLAPLLARRPHQLSGGERQRVAIGRALLSQPRLLLLDEPLAALDLARREELLPYLERLRDRLSIPIVYVSHQFDEVLRLATHVVLLDAGTVTAEGDPATISRRAELRAIVGPEALGAVMEGEVESTDEAAGVARVRIGESIISVAGNGHVSGQRLRLYILARDAIVAVSPPQGLSVRNVLKGTVTAVDVDGPHTRLIEIDVGGSRILARVTAGASTELQLRPDLPVWILVKAVSLHGHAFALRPSFGSAERPHSRPVE